MKPTSKPIQAERGGVVGVGGGGRSNEGHRLKRRAAVDKVLPVATTAD